MQRIQKEEEEGGGGGENKENEPTSFTYPWHCG
jgi:hypothetical protein